MAKPGNAPISNTISVTGTPSPTTRLNKKPALIIASVILLVVGVAVYALKESANKTTVARSNPDYKPSPTESFLTKFLQGRPDGVIGDQPSNDGMFRSSKADEKEEGNVDANADAKGKTTKPGQTGERAVKADIEESDHERPDLSKLAIKHQENLQTLAYEEEIRAIKQRLDQEQKARTSSATVEFSASEKSSLNQTNADGNEPESHDRNSRPDSTEALRAVMQGAMGGSKDQQQMQQEAMRAFLSSVGGPRSSDDGGFTSVTDSDASQQDKKQQFLRSDPNKDNYLRRTRVDPLGLTEMKAGTLIPATLITGVNSDLPGQLLAQVSQNVYDSATHQYVMVPQGAKLIGKYDSNVSYAQNRTLVVWNRIIYPDGSSLDLEGMQGHDTEGYAGFYDKVNNHYVRLFGSAILVSVMGASLNSIEDRNRSTAIPYGGLSERDEFEKSLGRELNRLAVEITRKNLRIAPTLEIRPGYRFVVMVNKDAVLEPYAPMQSLAASRGHK